MSYTEKVAEKMNNLLIKNYNAQKGFVNSSKQVESTNLKTYFRSKASEREVFADELKREIISYGETPKDSNSTQRAWIDVDSDIAENGEEVVLKKVQRGEKKSLEDYNKVLAETSLPQSTHAMLLRHRNAIKKSVKNVQRYEHIIS